MKKITILLITLLFISGTSFNQINAENKEEISLPSIQTFEFDLDSSYQSRQFYDNEGYLTTITVIKPKSAAEERHVFVSNVHLTLSYTVLIQNNRIVDAYNQSYQANTWTVDNDSLIVNSNTRATYTVQCHYLSIHYSKYAQANLNNGVLTVTSNL